MQSNLKKLVVESQAAQVETIGHLSVRNISDVTVDFVDTLGMFRWSITSVKIWEHGICFLWQLHDEKFHFIAFIHSISDTTINVLIG